MENHLGFQDLKQLQPVLCLQFLVIYRTISCTCHFALTSLINTSCFRLITVARGIGCKVTLDKRNKKKETDDPIIIISLKVPLTFPKPRVMPKQKR